jgi:hypothetical protein
MMRDKIGLQLLDSAGPVIDPNLDQIYFLGGKLLHVLASLCLGRDAVSRIRIGPPGPALGMPKPRPAVRKSAPGGGFARIS